MSELNYFWYIDAHVFLPSYNSTKFLRTYFLIDLTTTHNQSDKKNLKSIFVKLLNEKCLKMAALMIVMSVR